MQAGGWGGRGTFLPRKDCLVALAISEPLSDVGRRRHLADPPDLADSVGDAVEPYGRRFVMPDSHRNGRSGLAEADLRATFEPARPATQRLPAGMPAVHWPES